MGSSTEGRARKLDMVYLLSKCELNSDETPITKLEDQVSTLKTKRVTTEELLKIANLKIASSVQR